jgi:hypothetical protein
MDKIEQVVCPKPCKDECGHKIAHSLLPICSDPICPGCIPVPQPGMPQIPCTQLSYCTSLIEAPLRAEIEMLNLALMNRKSEVIRLKDSIIRNQQ